MQATEQMLAKTDSKSQTHMYIDGHYQKRARLNDPTTYCLTDRLISKNEASIVTYTLLANPLGFAMSFFALRHRKWRTICPVPGSSTMLKMIYKRRLHIRN